jgi:hypothetical protein
MPKVKDGSKKGKKGKKKGKIGDYTYDKELLTCNYFTDGMQVREQIGKWEIYNASSWLVLLFLYRDRRPETGTLSGPRTLFVRYRYTQAYGWSKKSSFSLDLSVARPLCDLLTDLVDNWDKILATFQAREGSERSVPNQDIP